MRRNPGAAENGAEDVLGFVNTAMKDLATHACPHACPWVTRAAKEGNVKLFIVKVFILPIVICQRCSLWHAPSSTAPHAFLGRHVKDGHVKDAAQDVAEDVVEDEPRDMAQESAFGARAARALLASPPPPPPPPSLHPRKRRNTERGPEAGVRGAPGLWVQRTGGACARIQRGSICIQRGVYPP